MKNGFYQFGHLHISPIFLNRDYRWEPQVLWHVGCLILNMVNYISLYRSQIYDIQGFHHILELIFMDNEFRINRVAIEESLKAKLRLIKLDQRSSFSSDIPSLFIFLFFKWWLLGLNRLSTNWNEFNLTPTHWLFYAHFQHYI